MAKVLVFGGTGFVGTHVVKKLAQLGYEIIVPTRHQESGLHLQPFGNVGQIACVKVNFKNPTTLEPLFKDVTAVVNLVGILYQKRKNSFQYAHVDIPQMLVTMAQQYNIAHFVQMSALGIEQAKNSKYAQTKLNGQNFVLKNFPNSMIVKPSIIFGKGDGFFNMFNHLANISPVLPLIGGGKTKFQPVYVCDVSDAIVKGVQGKAGVYELAGTDVYSFKQLLEMMLKQTNRKRLLMPVPFKLAKFKAFFAEILPKPPLTRDQVELLKTDNILTNEYMTLKDLDINPVPLESILPAIL